MLEEEIRTLRESVNARRKLLGKMTNANFLDDKLMILRTPILATSESGTSFCQDGEAQSGSHRRDLFKQCGPHRSKTFCWVLRGPLRPMSPESNLPQNEVCDQEFNECWTTCPSSCFTNDELIICASISPAAGLTQTVQPGY